MRILMLGLLVAATPAIAQQKQTTGQVVGDVATTPLQDVNIKKKRIPEILELARGDPYSTTGLGNCGAINNAIGALTAELGPDFDSPEERKGLNAGKVAKGVVQSLIPFRGVIREVSGAANAQREWDAAVDAGIARRGFLRGIARTRGCRVTS